MQQWQYKILSFDDYDADLSDLVEGRAAKWIAFDALGIDGWELVAITPHQLADTKLPWAIFKRPSTPPEKDTP